MGSRSGACCRRKLKFNIKTCGLKEKNEILNLTPGDTRSKDHPNARGGTQLLGPAVHSRDDSRIHRPIPEP